MDEWMAATHIKTQIMNERTIIQNDNGYCILAKNNNEKNLK